MADEDYRRLSAACACGKELPVALGRGRPRKKCDECRAPKRAKPTPCEGQCPACLSSFVPVNSWQRFCCRDCARRTRRGSKPKQLWPLACKRCGARFESLCETAMYCSAACKIAECKERQRPGRKVIPLARIKERAAAAKEARKRRGEDHRRRIAEAAHRRAVLARPRECAGCGAPHPPGVRAKWCGSCAQARKQRARLEHKGTEAYRTQKRKSRLMRRARERASFVEPVDPYQVFDRDGWRCQLCGKHTPRSKRGTAASDAPELDHIIPLALRGEHSYRNTQCACRACNIAKGAKPMGQALLFG